MKQTPKTISTPSCQAPGHALDGADGPDPVGDDADNSDEDINESFCGACFVLPTGTRRSWCWLTVPVPVGFLTCLCCARELVFEMRLEGC